uniref:Uncharacterized protein n=1 Tax=Chromera velia CCMP2878 TaxID=1169474 RepID=A0A0G4IFJ6_9ALVE|eukprot:Cvel_2466.t1-p1 / transcript=Cvel_2466.t1 / gene=Cvel_2466 / organism=Chromera_velia_CCMP2878 / gene_product=hypothetical protein / transcript_product=hypothetical protein / location=Cvel_scaffold97:11518-11814(-) / protein_length=99 / sequence_SO=supercontig / SO=protein_coding / is_pseudo=false
MIRSSKGLWGGGRANPEKAYRLADQAFAQQRMLLLRAHHASVPSVSSSSLSGGVSQGLGGSGGIGSQRPFISLSAQAINTVIPRWKEEDEERKREIGET